MKKLYTLLVIAFLGFVGKAQIVNIPDANFKAALLAASNENNIASNLVTRIKIDINDDGQIQVSEALLVYRLEIPQYNITNLTGISAFTNLRDLNCFNNQITSLSLNSLTNLTDLKCGSNLLTSLPIDNLTNLIRLGCENNGITSLDIDNLTNLQSLICNHNPLSALSVSALTNLTLLDCDATTITSLAVNSLINLQYLHCAGNPITSLSVNNLTNLSNLECGSSYLTSLDTTNLTNLSHLNCSTSFITSLFIKNGINESFLDFSNCPYLQYICADASQVSTVQNKITTYGYTNCYANTYCSFTPGGTFYTIQGNTKYDNDSNGCDAMDINFPNLKLTFNDGVNTGNIIADTTGSYHNDVQAGTHTFSPVLENPTYFTTTPTNSIVTFPTAISPFTQDFCVSPNGIHNDLEVVLLPLEITRPGFDATYKIIYKNKGTGTQSGTVNLAFDDSRLDFVSALPNVTTQITNNLNWSFSNLLPFETREITFALNVNSPTETPAVNAGDILIYTATVTGITDETPDDNISTLHQTVVNAFDPNDKTCIEGTTVSPGMVGQYVHYIIRFENTGTANAQNIVVKDIINTAKYDVTSLVPISGSAPYTTKRFNTNQVEFIFQNINLPFDDANNDGYVAFKIKTKPDLLVGNTFSNNANIYFDYNFPIVTNTATTTVTSLGTQYFDFGSVFTLSPVPAKDFLTVTTYQDVIMSSSSIYNKLGQLVQVTTNPNETIDVSGLQSGSYFIRITSDKGSATGKFIKE